MTIKNVNLIIFIEKNIWIKNVLGLVGIYIYDIQNILFKADVLIVILIKQSRLLINFSDG